MLIVLTRLVLNKVSLGGLINVLILPLFLEQNHHVFPLYSPSYLHNILRIIRIQGFKDSRIRALFFLKHFTRTPESPNPYLYITKTLRVLRGD